MGASKKHQYPQYQLQFAQTAKAIGHPARVAIVRYLSEHGFTSNKHICRVVQLSVPTVSQHVSELKKAGLIDEYFIGNQHLLKLSQHAETALKSLQSMLHSPIIKH